MSSMFLCLCYQLIFICSFVVSTIGEVCFKDCKKEFLRKFENVSVKDDCLGNKQAEEVFGAQAIHYTDPSNNVFCFRDHNGKSRMTSVSRIFDDPRFVCSNGPMSWYRGRKNRAFNDEPCLFWDEVLKSTFDISDGSSSSYSMRRILPDEYENFCRNPDKNPHGPWCYIDLKNVGIIKAACFEPCRNMASDSFICLEKKGFPYYNDDYDMSDILDLPQLVATFEHVHLMSESRYILPVNVPRRQKKTCINSGVLAKTFGPWIAVLDEEARKFIKSVGRRKLIEMCSPHEVIEPIVKIEASAVSELRYGLEEDELTVGGCSFWRRCFSACQDDVTSCWDPNDYEYYGSKKLSSELHECLSWTEASMSIITVVRNSKNIEESTTSSSIYHLFHHILFEDPNSFFTESRIFLNTDNLCMLLKSNETLKNDLETRFLETELSKYVTLEKYKEVYENLFHMGPGCFVKKEKILTFEPCYKKCNKESINVRNITKPLCLMDKQYSLCSPPKAEKHLTRGRYVRKQSFRRTPSLMEIFLIFSISSSFYFIFRI